ncbi:MAG: binding domain protein [Abditibacteriota bacterium]|nr:binding domain protein [Abditibacteriota bacterium]
MEENPKRMAVEVGQIVQGRVVRLLAYGVLVRLEDSSTGLVHISEIDQNYVRDVADYFALDDTVNVKVLAAGERGKIELSVKQARGEGEPVPMRQNRDNDAPRGDGPRNEAPRDGDRGERGDGPPARRESRASFEEKMGDFMRSSSERLSDLKRNIENKRGGQKKR